MNAITFYKRYDRTTEYYLLPLNQDQIEAIVAHYVSGQSSTIECVHGITRCHPKDKQDRKVGMEEAQKKARKKKLKLLDVHVNASRVCLTTNELSIVMFKDSGKVIVK